MILHEIFRGVSRFPRYISYYIAENGFSLGQCTPVPTPTPCRIQSRKSQDIVSLKYIFWSCSCFNISPKQFSTYAVICFYCICTFSVERLVNFTANAKLKEKTMLRAGVFINFSTVQKVFKFKNVRNKKQFLVFFVSKKPYQTKLSNLLAFIGTSIRYIFTHYFSRKYLANTKATHSNCFSLRQGASAPL